MRKAVVLSLLLTGLIGCASPSPSPSSYGNFVENPTAASEKKMAADAVNQLVSLYPPASTLFTLQHTTPDTFGASLVEGVRAKGYALLEFKPPAVSSQTPSVGLPLRYILDQAAGSNMYRVTLLIGPQTLTRAYLVQAGTVYPAGNWVRKE